MSRIILTPGATGMTLTDMAPLRFYAPGPTLSSQPESLSLEEMGSGRYALTGLPVGWRMTGVFPPGLSFAVPDPTGPQMDLILGLREDGVSSSEIQLAMFVEGEPVTVQLTALGGSPSDYRVAGWPGGGGEHLVTWVRSGLHFRRTWRGGLADDQSSGFDWFEGQVIDHVLSTWPAMGSYVDRDGVSLDPPPLVLPNDDFAPVPGDAHLQVRFVWTSRVQYGVAPLRSYEAEGWLQHDVYVRRGSGTSAMMTLADRIEPMWQAGAIPGLSTYAAMPPRDVAVTEPWAARQIDVPFRWGWCPDG